MKKMLLLATTLLLSSVAWLQPLTGTYTIDPAVAAGGTNYQTFTAFIDTLETYGVSGAVTVNVKEGTYVESITFSGHAGASATNLVKFQSDPTNTLPVELTYANTASSEATVIMSNASYIQFDGLTLANTGSSYSRIVYFQSGCGNISFTDNIFNGTTPGSTSSFYSLVYGTSMSPTGEFTFNNNQFNNGSYALYLYAASSAMNPKLTVSNNVFDNFYYTGIWGGYIDTFIVENNQFTNGNQTGTTYGMRNFCSSSAPASLTVVQNNKLTLNTSGTMYGMYLYYIAGSASGDSRVVNNMISNSSTTGTGTRYGMYIYTPGNLNIWHNTISILDGSATSGRAMYIAASSGSLSYTPGNVNFQNNIMSNTGGGYAIEVTSAAGLYFNSLDYNVYNGTNPTPMRWGSSSLDFTGWQQSTGNDANGAFGDPLFLGPDDLHVSGTIANDVGIGTTGITTDIDGDARPMAPSTMVDIGADEYTPPACVQPSDLTAANATTSSADLGWTSNGTETQWTIEIVPAGTTPTGSGTLVTSNPYTATGLSGGTNYDFYVRADCSGGPSTFAGPFTFGTACSFYNAPWFEDFTTTEDPLCWSQSATSGGPWVYTGNPGYTASGTLDHTNGSTNNYAWIDHSGTDVGVSLITPLVDVSALNIPEVRFWVWSHATSTVPDPMNPTYVEAWDGTNWNTLGVVQGDFGPNWKEFNFVIPMNMTFGSNLVQIRFRAESGGHGSDFGNDILLDDVSIVEGPSCPQPYNLTTLAGGDNSSVVVGWDTGWAETEWKLEYGPVGFTPGTGTSLITTNKPDTITGMAPYSFFDVYVYAICSPGDTSLATGPIMVNTYAQGIYMETDADCGPGFIDISGTGTNLQLGDDDEAGYLLPFDWIVEGQRVDRITVGNNGGVVLNTVSANIVTTMNAGNGFYPFIQDLDDNISGTPVDGVYWEVLGTAPNRQYVILWKDRTRYPGTSNPDPCTFEMIFEEASGEVYFVYPDVDFSNPNYDFGKDAEIGFRGNVDVNISINSNTYLQENSCVHFYYTDCPKPSNLITAYVTSDEAAFQWTAGVSNETDWMVVYGPTGFDPATQGTTLTTTASQIQLTGLDQLTDYDICVYALCASGDTSLSVCGTFRTLPFCSDVTGIGANSEIDSIIADWSWTQSSVYNITGFDTYYGGMGFDPLTEGSVYTGDTLYGGDTIADASLLAGGVYEIYVQAVCDTLKSNLVGPISIVMPLTNDSACGAQELQVDGIAHAFSNQGATVQQGEIGVAPPVTGAQETDGWANNNIDYTTWFKFTAPASGMVRISGVDVEYNGQVAVYEVTDCGLFSTFNLKAANDDDIDGTSEAPNFTFCELTPGNEYYLMHDAGGSVSTGIYSLKISEIDLNAGTFNGLFNICSKDTINMFDALTGNDSGGTWVDLENTFHIVNDSMFNTKGMAYDIYSFEYRLVDGCALDSIVAKFEVYPPSTAGTDGGLTICKNQPIGLLSALGGTITAGGTWFDANNVAMPSDYIGVGDLSIAGSYNFLYTVGNGVCPEDTAIVTVTVLNTCDFLGVNDLTTDALSIYPNPSTGEVNIELGDALDAQTITILDINGQKLTTVSLQDGVKKTTVDVSKFANGVYIIQVDGQSYSVHKRIIKQ